MSSERRGPLHSVDTFHRPSFSDVPVKTEYFVVNGQRNPDFLYNGMWEVLTEFGGWGK